MTSNDDDVTPVHPAGEILDRVYARARHIQRRKRVVRAGSGLLALGLLFAAGIGVSSLVGTKKTPDALNKPSASPSPSATTKVLGVTKLPRTGGTIGSAAQLEPSGPVCVDSYNAACGKFYWYPAPGPNTPMTVTGTISAETVTVGETVTVHVSATDPDAAIWCSKMEWGPVNIGFAIRVSAKYGRWVTPPKKRGAVSKTYTHVYTQPGRYPVDFSVESGACGRPDLNPYSDSGGWGTAITVLPAPSPSGTPTPTGSPSSSPSATTTPSPTSSP